MLADGVDAVSVQLLAPPPPASFGHAVALRYVVTLRAGQLANELVVDNTSGAEFKFQALLHNYIRVSDIGAATVQGIDAGVPYADKLLGGQVSPAPGGPLAFASETDR